MEALGIINRNIFIMWNFFFSLSIILLCSLSSMPCNSKSYHSEDHIYFFLILEVKRHLDRALSVLFLPNGNACTADIKWRMLGYCCPSKSPYWVLYTQLKDMQAALQKKSHGTGEDGKRVTS